MRFTRHIFLPTALAFASLLCVSAHAAKIASTFTQVVNGNDTYDNYRKAYSKQTDVIAACRADLTAFGFDPDLRCTGGSSIFAGYLQSPTIPSLFYSFFWTWCAAGTDYDPTGENCKPVKLTVDVLKPCDECGVATEIGDPEVLQRGNPIRPLTGSKVERIATGMSIGGLPLSFHYDSVRQIVAAAEGRDLNSWNDLPSLGALWSTNLHRKLVVSPRDAQAYRGAGAIVSFAVESGGFVPGADVRDRLVTDGTGYAYTDAASGAVEHYDADGRLTTLTPISGGVLTFVHSTSTTPASIAPAPGYLIGTSDSDGRAIAFAYALPAGGDPSTDGKLTSVTDHQGRVLAMAYDAQANLTTLTWQDGTTNQLLYENAAFPSALTGVINANGTRRSTFGYDSRGFAVSTTRAGGAEQYSVASATPPEVVMTKVVDAGQNIMVRTETWSAPTGMVLTLPNGTTSALTSSSLIGANVVTSMSQVAGAGSPAATSTTVYNANAKQIQRDDVRGVRWCAAYDDARNLPLVEVDGLSSTVGCASVTPPAATLPAGSFKTTTSWHPNWSLPLQVDAPLMRTTMVYNGQPDPFAGGVTASCVVPADLSLVVACKRVEQATLDLDGHLGASAVLDTTVPARVWRSTFDPRGQVLTARGPRTDIDDTTTFSYYTDTSFTGADPNAVGHQVGDLQTVTDATGQVTTYAAYNKNGQPLSAIDANGVASTMVYDARGRLTSMTVGGQATAYAYDLNGQLHVVTLPDGATTLTFEHDAALRQTAVFDNLGNRIDYTLNTFGSRTADNAKDPSGTLARAVTRAMDALNRAQRATGATVGLGQE